MKKNWIAFTITAWIISCVSGKVLSHVPDLYAQESFFNQGVQSFNNQEYGNAIQYFQNALRDLPPNDSLLIARCHLHIGQCYYHLNRYQEAITHLETCKILLRQIRESSYLVDCYLTLGWSHYQSEQDGGYDLAIENFSSARTHADQNPSQTSECDYGLGLSYLKKETYNRAIQYLNQSQAVGAGSSRWFYAQFNKSVAYMGLEDYRPAISELRLFLKNQPQQVTPDLIPIATLYLGQCHIKLQQFDSALVYYQNAEIQFNDSTNKANCLKQMAVCFHQLKNYNKTIESAARAAGLYIQLNDSASTAECMKLKGDAQYNDNHFQEALDSYKQGLTQCINPEQKADFMFDIGTVYNAMDSSQSAIYAFEDAGRGYFDLQITSKAADCVYHQGYCRYHLDQSEKAKALFDSSAALWRTATQYQPEVRKSLKMSAHCLNQMNRHEEALPIWRELVDYFKRNNIPDQLAECEEGLGNAYMAMERYHDAEPVFQSALRLFGTLKDTGSLARCHFNLGVISDNPEHHQVALDHFWKSHNLSEQVNDSDMQAKCLWRIAGIRMTMGMLDEAESLIEKAKGLTREPGVFADCYQLSAIIQFQRQPLDTMACKTNLDASLAFAKQAGDSSRIQATVYQYGRFYIYKQQWEEAQFIYIHLSDYYQRHNEFQNQAACLMNLGDIDYNQKDKNRYQSAISWYKKSMEIITREPNIDIAHYKIALAYYQLKNFQESRKNAQQAINVFTQLNMGNELAECYGLTGDINQEEGAYQEAANYYDLALDRTTDLIIQADINIKKGELSFKVAQWENAERYFQQGISYYYQKKEIRSVIGRMIQYARLLIYYQFQQKGLDTLDRVSIVGENWHLNMDEEKLEILLIKGNALYEVGLPDSAMFCNRQGLDLASTKNNAFYQAAFTNAIGNVYLKKEQYDTAMVEYSKALEFFTSLMDTQNIGACQINLGNIYHRKNQYDMALSLYDSAKTIFERYHSDPDIAILHNNIGTVYLSKKDYDKSLDHFQSAEHIFDKHYLKRFQVQVYSNQGETYEQLGNYDSAYTAYSKAIRLVEESRGQFTEKRLLFGYIQSRADLFERMISLLSERPDSTAAAIAYIERSRSENLIEEYRNTLIASHPELVGPLDSLNVKFQQWNQIQCLLGNELAKPLQIRNDQLINNLTRNSQKLESEIQINDDFMADRDPNYYGGISIRIAQINNMQALIPDSVAVIWYYAVSRSLYIHVVCNTGIKSLVLRVPIATLYACMDSLRNAMTQTIEYALQKNKLPMVESWSDPSIQKMLTLSEKLYDWFFKPIEPWIGNKKILILIPNGNKLPYFPYSSLCKIGKDGQPRFTVEKWQLSVLLSSMLPTINTRDTYPKWDERLTTVLADPNGSLLGARSESELLRDLLQKRHSRTRIEVGPSATEELAIQLAHESWIFIPTTHVYVNPDHPDSSFIFLSPSQGYDGYWQYREIQNQPVRYDNTFLVVLDNCMTAIGETNPKNEPKNLVRAFTDKGAASVLATLWSVSDLATYNLMSSFYKEIYRPDLSNDQLPNKLFALQQAQIKLIQDPKYRHPFLWSGFIMYGLWR